jgi:protease-4
MNRRRFFLTAFFALTAAALTAESTGELTFRTFPQNAALQLGAPAGVPTGLSGFLNPALLAEAVDPELFAIFSNLPGQWTSISDIGFFTASPGSGLGLLYFPDPNGEAQINFREGLGFGDRSYALGISNETAWNPRTGQSLFFQDVSVGAFIRPLPQISLGIVGTTTYTGNAMEATADIGIRPFGTSLLTIFGYYNLGSISGSVSSAWSVGAAAEPLPGLRLAGSYASDSTFTLGATVGFGATDIGANVHFPGASLPDSNTYSIRLGPEDGRPSILTAVKKGPYYLELDLLGAISAQQSPFGGSYSLLGLLRMIEAAGNDPRISGIAINTSGMQADQESLWEMREQLKKFKSSGKHVVVFVDSAGIAVYYFASVADKIVMDPQGVLELAGFTVGREYLKGSLEKLGIGFTELRYLPYKSANETFSRDSFSEADRTQYGAYLADVYRVTKEDILKDRGLTSDAFESLINDGFLFYAGEARERGLVDVLGRWEEVKKTVTDLEGGEKLYMKFGASYQGSFLDAMNALFPPQGVEAPSKDRWSEPPAIDVIYAIGSTSLDSGMVARKLALDIEAAANDWTAKAIVLRVDSPGGDAIAADYVAEAVKAAGKKKPVIVSMGSVAGSGGYWVSLYGDAIVASPFSGTGSIGVIGGWFYDNGLNDKLGITMDFLSIGKHADLGAGFLFPNRDLTPDETDRYKTMILSMYADFVAKAAEGRGKTKEEIEKIAQGRVWSGLAAKEIGLVDEVGGIMDAINLAMKKAGLSPTEEITVREYPGPDIFSSLSALTGSIYSAERSADFSALELLGLGGMNPGKPAPREVKALDYLRLRLQHNGEALPILPMDEALGF